MREISLFLYGWYEYYFILFSGMVGTILAYFFSPKRHWGVKDKCLCYASMVLFNFATAVLLKNCFMTERNGMREHIVAFVLENGIAIILGGVYALIVLKGKKVNVPKIKILIRENVWGVTIFISLLVYELLHGSTAINSWVSLWYVTDYSMGIGSRFFVGSIINLFVGDFVDADFVNGVCTVIYVLIIFGVALMLNSMIKRIADTTTRQGVIFVILVFLLSPGSIVALATNENWGRLEMYGLLLGFISIYIFENVSNMYVKYVSITVLSCITMAIYQGNIFMYYPIWLMLIVYDGIHKHGKGLLQPILAGLNIILTCIMFFFFQFCSNTNFDTAEEMSNVLQEKTNLSVVSTALDLELFQPLSEAWKRINTGFLIGNEYPRERAFVTMIILLPMIIVVMSIYIKCREHRIQNGYKTLQCPYIYYVLVTCAILPQYLLNVDWGRYMLATTIVMFTGIFYLCYKKDEGMLLAMQCMGRFVEEHKILCLMLLFYLCSLSKFNARVFTTEVNKVMERVMNCVG